MKLKNDLIRFQLHSKTETAYICIPKDTVWAVASYPEGRTQTCVLYTEKDNFEIVGTEEDVYKILGWLYT